MNTNTKESDVCILGNVKVKYEPPGDVPDSLYGETLKRFREHIHRRVTDTKDDGSVWEGRSIFEFSEYIKEVWKCIGSANFALNFANIREHAAFDSLDSDYKQIERCLAEAYFKAYQQVEKEMVKQKKASVNLLKSDEELRKQFENTLENTVKAGIHFLDDAIKNTVHRKGREKWVPQYENQWELWKSEQAQD